MASNILIIFSVALVLHVFVTAAQAPPDARFYGIAANRVSKYDYTGTHMTNFACTMDSSTSAMVGADGRLWTAGNQRLNWFDPETGSCGSIATGNFNASGVASSPRGTTIFFIASDQNMYTLKLRTQAVQILYLNGNNVYHSVASVGSKLVASRLPYETVETYPFDTSNDALNLQQGPPTVQRVNITEAFIKVKKCPVSTQEICGMTATAILRSGSDMNPYMYTLLSAGTNIFDYWTSPWQRMYVSTLGNKFYEYNTSNSTIHLTLPAPTLIGNYSNEEAFVGFASLIDAPTVSYTSSCQTSFQFNSYIWTKKYTIQMINETTGLFEDFHTESNPTTGQKNHLFDITCTSATTRFRVYYEGDVNYSEPVYSVPKTLNCACAPSAPQSAPVPVTIPQSAPVAVPTVPNVIPILECIEQTDNGLLVHLGYNNLESSTVQLAVGPNNRFSDVDNRNQPTSFAVGRSNFYPASAFKFPFSGSATWFLSTYTLNFDTSDTSVYCPSNASFVLSFTSAQIVTEQDIQSIQQSLTGFLNVTSNRIKVLSWKSTPATKKRAANVVDVIFAITAAQNSNELSAAESVRTIVALVNQSPQTLNEIINAGDDNNGRTVQSVSTVATGTEQQGQQTAPPTSNIVPQSASTPTSSTPISAVSEAVLNAPTVLVSLCLLVVTLY